MKRSDIRNAYDTMTPTSTQKDEMFRKIMENAPKQSIKAGKYQSHTQRTSFLSLIPAVAALFVVILAGVFVIGRTPQTEVPVQVEPTADVQQPEENTIPNVYLELITYCKSAIYGNIWSEEKCEELNISPRFAASRDYAATNAGYQILDIDGNGTLELIIGHENYIWNLYTLQGDNTAVQLINDTNDGTVYQLHEGGRIVKELTTKEEGWHDCYRFSGISLEQETSIYGKDTDYFDILAGGEPISSQEALDRIDKYDRVDLELIPFYDFPDSVQNNLEAVENYTPVIEKYKTALLENWSWEQCDEAGISRSIMYGTTDRSSLGWTLLDLDNNGIEELIVSDGSELFDLYTLNTRNGKLTHLLSNSDSGISVVICRDGTIQEIMSKVAYTSWTWHGYSDGYYELSFLEEQKLILDNTTHQYSISLNGQDPIPITENEAGAYITAEEKQPMELELVPFADLPKSTAREPNYYYEPIIELYRKAIVEAWDPGTCIENGISLMIGYYGEQYDQLGQNQVDLNGDGNDELIITDGTNIYDMYTVIYDEEDCALRILDATERKRYFMIDEQTIYCWASNHAASSFHVLLSAGERELYTTEGFVYDGNDPDGPWFTYDGENKGSAYPDAETIIDSWEPIEIPFIPFGDGGLVQTSEQSEWEQAKEAAFDIIRNGDEFGYGEYIAWLIPWRNQEFENPRPLYYYLHDSNGDGIADLVLGYEDEVTAVWSYMYDEKAKEEHLTLLNLTEEEWSELDSAWPNWDIRLIEDFLR